MILHTRKRIVRPVTILATARRVRKKTRSNARTSRATSSGRNLRATKRPRSTRHPYRRRDSGFPITSQRVGSKGCLPQPRFMRAFAPCFASVGDGQLAYLLRLNRGSQLEMCMGLPPFMATRKKQYEGSAISSSKLVGLGTKRLRELVRSRRRTTLSNGCIADCECYGNIPRKT